MVLFRHLRETEFCEAPKMIVFRQPAVLFYPLKDSHSVKHLFSLFHHQAVAGKGLQRPTALGLHRRQTTARQQALQEVVAGKLRGADQALAEAARRAGLKKD